MLWVKGFNKYRKYLSYFRMRFIAGLQYRAAAIAGISTQFVWGIMQILLYKAFYEVNPNAFPMTFQAIASYVWLQQSLLALFMTWFFENDIFRTITEGNIVYELCRPADLYDMWFSRSMANRLSKAVLRCFPILIIAALLPKSFGISLPDSVNAGLWFVVATFLGFLVVVAFCMLVYISTFFTYSPMGVRMLAVAVVELLSGGVLPLPFFPNGIRQAVELLPFASMQNVPLRIYSGDIGDMDIYGKVMLQLFWVIILIWLGKSIMKTALRRVVVQGG